MLKNKHEFIKQKDHYIVKIHSKTYGIVDVLVDIDDFDRVKNIAWNINKTNRGLLYIRGKFKVNNKYKNIMIHRYLTNCPNGKVVDHINRNTLDNRKKNLKICSILENNQNKKYKKNSTGERNIYFDGYGYNVTKQYNKKYYYIGYYKTLAKAIEARNNFKILEV